MIDDMTVIDGHVHMFRDEELASKIMAVFNQKYDIPFKNTGKGTPSDLDALMKSRGIDYSIIANFSSPKHCDNNNRWTLACAAENKHFIPLISFHPEMPLLSASLIDEYCRLGAKGIKLHPMAQEFDPQNEKLFQYYEYAGRKKLPVVFHCGRVANARINAYADSEKIVPVLEKFPETLFVLNHMVDGSEQDIIDIAKRYTNVFFDTSIVISGNEMILQHNLPSWSDDAQCLRVFRQAGVDRFLFGSDYPWGNPDMDVQRFMAMALTSSEKKQICGGNADALFNIAV